MMVVLPDDQKTAIAPSANLHFNRRVGPPGHLYESLRGMSCCITIPVDQ